MARMPSGEPRSVPDPAGDDYDRMMRRWRADMDAEDPVSAAQAAIPSAMTTSWPAGEDLNMGLSREDYGDMIRQFQQAPPIGHPGLLESLIPIWGSGREALADFQEKDYPWATANAVMTLLDGGIGASVVEGLAKGAVKTAAPHVWRMQPWRNKVEEGVMDASTWMRQVRNGMRHLEPGQPAHHWAIPQNGWGKSVPDVIKNQPWNIKPMPDAVVHGRIHGDYLDLPRFNWLERIHYGVPTWPKLLAGSYLGRAADRLFDQPHSNPPPSVNRSAAPAAGPLRH